METEGRELGTIGRGVLLFLGVTHHDDMTITKHLAGKCANLRIFEDRNQLPHQCSVLELQLEALVVSQFTLYGTTSKGRRPGFSQSANPKQAEAIYEAFISSLGKIGIRTASGKFGAEMQVKLVNDGPVTYLLEK